MKFQRAASRKLSAAAAGIVSLCMIPAAIASPSVAMQSAVFVEKTETGNIRRLEPASRLSRGDRVVTIVSWYRMGGDGGFVITNPMPRAVAYQESARSDELVSIDGGRNWGRLGELRIGGRLATPEDVTHVRWRIPGTLASKGSGHIAYSGIVR